MKCSACGFKKIEAIHYNSRGESFKKLNGLKKFRRSTWFKVIEKFVTIKLFQNVVRLYTTTLPAFTEGEILVCQRCGFGEWNSPPAPPELMFYYQFGYRSFLPFSTIRIPLWRSALKATLSRLGILEIVGWVRRRLSPAPKWSPRSVSQMKFVFNHLQSLDGKSLEMLEVGGATCEALRLIRESLKGNVKLSVIEPDLRYARFYKRENIKKVADLFPFTSEPMYDYVHTSHWLEHMVGLKKTIEEVRSILKEDGAWFIEVPDCAGDYFQSSIDDIPHTLFFTKESLDTALTENGFKILKIETPVNSDVILCLAEKGRA